MCVMWSSMTRQRRGWWSLTPLATHAGSPRTSRRAWRARAVFQPGLGCRPSTVPGQRRPTPGGAFRLDAAVPDRRCGTGAPTRPWPWLSWPGDGVAGSAATVSGSQQPRPDAVLCDLVDDHRRRHHAGSAACGNQNDDDALAFGGSQQRRGNGPGCVREGCTADACHTGAGLRRGLRTGRRRRAALEQAPSALSGSSTTGTSACRKAGPARAPRSKWCGQSGWRPRAPRSTADAFAAGPARRRVRRT